MILIRKRIYFRGVTEANSDVENVYFRGETEANSDVDFGSIGECR